VSADNCEGKKNNIYTYIYGLRPDPQSIPLNPFDFDDPYCTFAASTRPGPPTNPNTMQPFDLKNDDFVFFGCCELPANMAEAEHIIINVVGGDNNLAMGKHMTPCVFHGDHEDG